MRKLMLLVLGCCLALALVVVSQSVSSVEAQGESSIEMQSQEKVSLPDFPVMLDGEVVSQEQMKEFLANGLAFSIVIDEKSGVATLKFLEPISLEDDRDEVEVSVDAPMVETVTSIDYIYEVCEDGAGTSFLGHSGGMSWTMWLTRADSVTYTDSGTCAGSCYRVMFGPPASYVSGKATLTGNGPYFEFQRADCL